MHAHEWERPVRAGLAALIGPIRQELLSGIRETAHWKRLRDALRPFRGRYAPVPGLWLPAPGALADKVQW